MSIRVLILHEHRLFREGLRAVLHGRGEVDVVADTADRLAIAALIGDMRPDVLVIDLAAGAPGAPHTPALVALGEDQDRFEVARALRTGIRAVVSKSDSPEEVLAAIRAAASGQVYVTPRFSNGGAPPLHPEGLRDPLRPLTGREREIFALVTRGSSTAAIARQLSVSPRTVETHRAHLSRKLGAHSAADLVRFAARHGLLVS